ncbi:MAG: ABC transporter permease, partial [Anaerolineales bacterium]|nr:ABC transporter permease [Anaerolineales bacterium]
GLTPLPPLRVRFELHSGLTGGEGEESSKGWGSEAAPPFRNTSPSFGFDPLTEGEGVGGPEMFAAVASIILIAAVTINALERLERRLFPPDVRGS